MRGHLFRPVTNPSAFTLIWLIGYRRAPRSPFATKSSTSLIRSITFLPTHGSRNNSGAMRGEFCDPLTASLLRASLVQELGLLGDEEVIKMCRQNFKNYLKDRTSVPADLRPPTFAIAMRYGNAVTWQKLHELGLKTTSTEDKQNYYDALAFATDSKLIQKSLAIALTDELPTSRAVFMVAKVARESDRPELAWEFAKRNAQALIAKVDAVNANSYLPSLFTFFSDPARIEELKAFAQKNLSEPSRKPVEIASDEILFHADLRKRLIEQIQSSSRSE